MEQSPSLKANCFSSDPVYPEFYGLGMFNYFYKNPHLNYHEPAKSPPMLKIDFSTILSSTSRFYKCYFFRNISVPRHSVNLSCLQYRRHVVGIDHVTACL
jgi:hypothetical protein